MLREFTLEPRPLGRLDYALAELAKLDDRRCERKVTLHTGGRTLEHRLGPVGDELDRRERLFEAAWSLLAEGLGCSDCMRVESRSASTESPSISRSGCSNSASRSPRRWSGTSRLAA